jgi:hypothetical protein
MYVCVCIYTYIYIYIYIYTCRIQCVKRAHMYVHVYMACYTGPHHHMSPVAIAAAAVALAVAQPLRTSCSRRRRDFVTGNQVHVRFLCVYAGMRHALRSGCATRIHVYIYVRNGKRNTDEEHMYVCM